MTMRYILVILSVLFISACAVTYKAAEDGVAGYRDLQVDKVTYYVEYTESAKTSWEQVHRFALKRCAEIAKEKGYAFFDVITKEQKAVFLETDVDTITISTMGVTASDPPVSNTYKTGGKVEGRRVTYKIRLANE